MVDPAKKVGEELGQAEKQIEHAHKDVDQAEKKLDHAKGDLESAGQKIEDAKSHMKSVPPAVETRKAGEDAKKAMALGYTESDIEKMSQEEVARVLTHDIRKNVGQGERAAAPESPKVVKAEKPVEPTAEEKAAAKLQTELTEAKAAKEKALADAKKSADMAAENQRKAEKAEREATDLKKKAEDEAAARAKAEKDANTATAALGQVVTGRKVGAVTVVGVLVLVAVFVTVAGYLLYQAGKNSRPDVSSPSQELQNEIAELRKKVEETPKPSAASTAELEARLAEMEKREEKYAAALDSLKYVTEENPRTRKFVEEQEKIQKDLDEETVALEKRLKDLNQ